MTKQLTLFVLTLFVSFNVIAQAPNGWLYLATDPDNFGFIEYPANIYTPIPGQKVRDISLNDNLNFNIYTAGENINIYWLGLTQLQDSIPNVHARKIDTSLDRIFVLSDSMPYFRAYDKFNKQLVFSLDSNKVESYAIDLITDGINVYILYSNSIQVINVVSQDTIGTFPTPSIFPSAGYNNYMCVLHDKIIIHVDYATGAIRYSLLEFDPLTMIVDTMYHQEFDGGTQKLVPDPSNSRIYMLQHLSYFDLATDTVYRSPQHKTFAVEYSWIYNTVFNYGGQISPGSYYIEYNNMSTAASDSVPIPGIFTEAAFYPGPTSVDETNATALQLLVIPNPASSATELQFGGHSYVKEVAVFDSSGKRVFIDKPNRYTDNLILDLDNFGAGIYIIRCQTDEGRYIGKVSVQRK